MDALQQVLAKQEIREQLYRYCRSMDRMDNPLGFSVFAKDSHVDYGPHFQGTGEEFVRWANNAHRKVYQATSHQMTNMLIQVSGDGLTAASETYLHTLQYTKPDANGQCRELHIAARYLDLWVQADGVWKISRRRYVQDIAELRVCQKDAGRFGGTRDYNDPSYSLFEQIQS